jgi:hypothetical protein
MALRYIVEPDQDPKDFTSFERQEVKKLEQALKSQGSPEGFSPQGLEIRRDKLSHTVYYSNDKGQMCMLNEGRLEIYYCCPKCRQMGFKNTIAHSSRCNEIIW